MKLIFCPECADVVALHREPRTCRCGRSSGHYKQNGWHAVVTGLAVPLGFANASFVEAIRTPDRGVSTPFKAFVIEDDCPSIERQP